MSDRSVAGPVGSSVPGTTPISDEAAKALLIARYGHDPEDGFLPASYVRAKAEIAAVAPLLVSAEAERRSWTLRDPSLWQLINDADPAVRQLLIEAWGDRDDALAVVEGLRVRAELAEAKSLLEQGEQHHRDEAEWLANGLCMDSGMPLVREGDRLMCGVCDCFGHRLRAAGGQEKPNDVHKPFTDDGVTYCGWDGHEGCGEVWPCSTVRAAAPVGGQAEPSDARAGALIEAADEVHREARWQTEQKLRTAGISETRATIQFGYSIERLGLVEQILRDRAAAVSGEQATPGERCSFKAPAQWGVSGCLLPAGHPDEHEHVPVAARPVGVSVPEETGEKL